MCICSYIASKLYKILTLFSDNTLKQKNISFIETSTTLINTNNKTVSVNNVLAPIETVRKFICIIIGDQLAR